MAVDTALPALKLNTCEDGLQVFFYAHPAFFPGNYLGYAQKFNYETAYIYYPENKFLLI